MSKKDYEQEINILLEILKKYFMEEYTPIKADYKINYYKDFLSLLDNRLKDKIKQYDMVKDIEANKNKKIVNIENYMYRRK